jgi:hypothetical protein
VDYTFLSYLDFSIISESLEYRTTPPCYTGLHRRVSSGERRRQLSTRVPPGSVPVVCRYLRLGER